MEKIMMCAICSLGSIAVKYATPTQNAMLKVKQFLNYAATHPYAVVTCNASNMFLSGHSNASYLSETKA